MRRWRRRLAAMQIAPVCVARESRQRQLADKRALVELFGAEKVYNSRSVAFLDAIRRIWRRGCCAEFARGNAMAASINA